MHPSSSTLVTPDPVGAGVGAGVGAAVGAGVGAAVGEAVGAAVGVQTVEDPSETCPTGQAVQASPTK